LGFSHLVIFKLPESIYVSKIKKDMLLLRSNNLNTLTQTIFLLKTLRKFNSYKEKGIKLTTDALVLKEGKKSF
jgi:ribosomal protein L6P/L9E